MEPLEVLEEFLRRSKSIHESMTNYIDFVCLHGPYDGTDAGVCGIARRRLASAGNWGQRNRLTRDAEVDDSIDAFWNSWVHLRNAWREGSGLYGFDKDEQFGPALHNLQIAIRNAERILRDGPQTKSTGEPWGRIVVDLPEKAKSGFIIFNGNRHHANRNGCILVDNLAKAEGRPLPYEKSLPGKSKSTASRAKDELPPEIKRLIGSNTGAGSWIKTNKELDSTCLTE